MDYIVLYVYIYIYIYINGRSQPLNHQEHVWHLGHTINAASLSWHHLNVVRCPEIWWICWKSECQVALTQSERSNIPSGKGDSRMHLRIHSVIQCVFFTFYCFVIQSMMFYVSFMFFCSPSKLVCHGLPMFAKWHVSTSGMMQGCSGKQPKNLGRSLRCCEVLATESKWAKRLRFIQTFIRTFTTWVKHAVFRREKTWNGNVYNIAQIATNKTSKLQTLHCSPSKAGSADLWEFVAFADQNLLLLDATRSDGMMAGQHSLQHIRRRKSPRGKVNRSEEQEKSKNEEQKT